MNNQIQKQEAEQIWLGLPKQFATAVISTLLSLLFLIPVEFMPINRMPDVLMMIGWSLQGWGVLILYKISALSHSVIPDSIFHVAVIAISILPISIIGFMIGSNKRSTIIKGIITLMIYLCVAFFGGMLVWSLAF